MRFPPWCVQNRKGKCLSKSCRTYSKRRSLKKFSPDGLKMYSTFLKAPPGVLTILEAKMSYARPTIPSPLAPPGDVVEELQVRQPRQRRPHLLRIEAHDRHGPRMIRVVAHKMLLAQLVEVPARRLYGRPHRALARSN